MLILVVVGAALVFGLGLLQLGGPSGGAAGIAMLGALVAFLTLALVIRDVKKLLLAVIILELPVPIDVYLFYEEEFGNLGAVGGLNISLTTAVLALLYGLWIVDVLLKRSPPKEERFFWGAAGPLAGYIGLVAVSVVAAVHRPLAIYELIMLAQMFLLYIYLLHAIRSWKDVRFVTTLLMIGLIGESLVMLAVTAIGETVNVGLISARVDEFSGRVGGTIGSYNNAAAYFSVMLAIAAGLFFRGERGWLRTLAIVGGLLGTVAIIPTGSRGGWLALIVALAIIGFANWRRGWLPPGVPLALAGGVVCVAVIFQSLFAERFFGEDQTGASSRIPLASLAIRIITDNPILGVGANNFAVRADGYWPNRGLADWLFVVHNKFLLVASENGILAFIVFLIFLLVTIRFGYRAWRMGDRYTAPLVLCFTAALVGHMVHMQLEILNDRGQVELLWIICAMIAVMYRLTIVDYVADDHEAVEEFVDTPEPPVLIVSGTEPSWRVTSGADP